MCETGVWRDNFFLILWAKSDKEKKEREKKINSYTNIQLLKACDEKRKKLITSDTAARDLKCSYMWRYRSEIRR